MHSDETTEMSGPVKEAIDAVMSAWYAEYEASPLGKAAAEALERAKAGGNPTIDFEAAEVLVAAEQENASLEGRLAEAFANLPEGVMLTADELMTAVAYVDRNAGPSLLWKVVMESNRLRSDALPEAVPSVWSSAEFPEQYLDTWDWGELFSEAGFTIDYKPAERPTEPVRLYRGSNEDHREGMAWTSDRERAAWFASRPTWPTPGKVWTALVEPDRLLAIVHDRDEAEHIVWTEGLDIVEAK